MKKINPWMLATIFLLGLIIGFGIGRISIGPAAQPSTTVTVPKGTNDTAATGSPNNGGTVVQQPPVVQTNAPNDYTKIEKSVDKDGHFSIGNKNAKVKIVEYSDFQCPFCYRYFMNTFPQILKDYIATGKVYYTFSNFPLNIHPQAPKAAEAALCAGEQNKFWEFHDLLFANQNVWSGIDSDVPIFANLAQSAGLDGGKLTDCVNSGKYTAAVSKDSAAGDKKDISGTPTVFINDQKVVGAQDYIVFKQAIETELSKK